MQAADPEYLSSLRGKSTTGLNAILESSARHLAEREHRAADLDLDLTDGTVAMANDFFTKLVDELIDNALKFSSPGKRVRITASQGRGEYLLSIADSGVGMTAEQIADIGAYSQFDRGHREQQGSGLGLAIARRIVENHAGQFDIKSTLGEGTTVSLRLPS